MPSTREAALALCQTLTPRLEGCTLTAIADPVRGWAVPTIGYGHTRGVVKGQTITQDTANFLLGQDLGDAADELEKVCNLAALAGIDSHQRAALIDFVFNLGAGPSWQIWKDINSGDDGDVTKQIMRFVNGEIDGKEQVVEGLEHRRQAEVVFWNTADENAAVAVTQVANAVPAPASGYTRTITTNPTPVAPPPLANVSLAAKSLTVVGGIAAAVGSNAQQVHDIIAPAADSAPIFQTLATVAIGAVVVAGIVGLFIHEAQAQARKT
jgi:lysozyme